jgi:hypothetical protein
MHIVTYKMRNLLRTLKTTIASSQRRIYGRAADTGTATNAKDNDSSNNEKEVDDLGEMDRITKRDSKKERRQKFRSYFERNSVCMVSKFLGFRRERPAIWWLD